MLRIAIDAMGGDNGTEPIIDGVIQALKEKHFHAILVGDELTLKPLVPKVFYKNVSICDSKDIFSMDSSATDVLKRKESSIYKAVDLVRNKEADAVVSAGHSGATMSLSTLRIGRAEGILRPAIATLMPTRSGGKSLVLDVGANVDCKAEHLLQFVIMGEVYAKNVLKIPNPTVGILSNGEEEGKGNEVTKEAFKLIENNIKGFIGNVEGNDIFNDKANVIVCDGFVGNILLKTSEGVAESISHIIKQNVKRSPIAIAGSLLMKKVFYILKKQVDYAEYGGAPLLGVKNCTIISHGKSNPKAIKNAIFQAIKYVESDVSLDIQKEIDRLYTKG